MNFKTNCRNGKDSSEIKILVSDETNPGNIVSSPRIGNKHDVVEIKSLNQIHDNGKNAIEFKVISSTEIKVTIDFPSNFVH